MVRPSTIIFALGLSAAPTLALWIPNEHEHGVLAPRGNCIGTLDAIDEACRKVTGIRAAHRATIPNTPLHREGMHHLDKSEPPKDEKETFLEAPQAAKLNKAQGNSNLPQVPAAACGPEGSAGGSSSGCSSSGEATETGKRSVVPEPGYRQIHDAEVGSESLRQRKRKSLQ